MKRKDDKKIARLPLVTSIAGTMLVLIVAACILSPLIAPYGMSEQSLSESLNGPSWRHLLGTDKMGRDLFSRLLYGGRVTFVSAVSVVALSALIGVPLGMVSGYFGGWLDSLVGRFCDILIAFPSLLLALLFVSSFGRGLKSAVIAMGIAFVPMVVRLARSLTLVEKNKTYVEAARSIGFSSWYVIFRHIMPNCLPTIAVQFALDLGYAVLSLAGLSFLGLGVQPPTADWGAMLEEGRGFLLNAPWLALAPGIAISLVVLLINLLCDGVQQYLNPSEQSLPSFRWYERHVEKLE
jgi:peptide/nickel transport system permease protein